MEKMHAPEKVVPHSFLAEHYLFHACDDARNFGPFSRVLNTNVFEQKVSTHKLWNKTFEPIQDIQHGWTSHTTT